MCRRSISNSGANVAELSAKGSRLLRNPKSSTPFFRIFPLPPFLPHSQTLHFFISGAKCIGSNFFRENAHVTQRLNCIRAREGGYSLSISVRYDNLHVTLILQRHKIHIHLSLILRGNFSAVCTVEFVFHQFIHAAADVYFPHFTTLPNS